MTFYASRANANWAWEALLVLTFRAHSESDQINQISYRLKQYRVFRHAIPSRILYAILATKFLYQEKKINSFAKID